MQIFVKTFQAVGKVIKIMLLSKKEELRDKVNISILLPSYSIGEKAKSAVHFGKMTHYIPENNVYTYFRYNDNETVMVLINNSNETHKINTHRFKENIKDFKTGKDVISELTFDVTNEIIIEPKSVLILELK